MELNSILLMIISSILTYCVGRAQIKASRRDKEEEAKDKLLQELAENYKKLVEGQRELLEQYKEIKAEIRELKKANERLKAGGLALLRDRIIQSCRAFIARGSITLTARNNISGMFKVYHDEFDGNGDGEYYFHKMEKLPIDDTPMVSSIQGGVKV